MVLRTITIILAVWCSGALPGCSDEVAPGILRTPEARFADLEGYPFAPHYLQIGDHRVHYVDEGPREADPVLLLHGEPTWSYLYRKMIPVLAAAGHRVIAPDLVGFGKSDKPVDPRAHSYQMHVDTMLALVESLDLRGITFFGQDWGGLIGLRVVTAAPDRFGRIVVGNTALPAAEGILGWIGYPLFKVRVWWEGEITLEELRENVGFIRWVAYSRAVDDMPIGEIVGMLGIRGGSSGLIRAYEAPFPDARYKAGPHIMPYLVPSQLRENAEAWKVLEQWTKPLLTAFSDGDPITRGADGAFRERIPGARGRDHVTITGAGHFLQEDKGEELAEIIAAFIAETADQPGR